MCETMVSARVFSQIQGYREKFLRNWAGTGWSQRAPIAHSATSRASRWEFARATRQRRETGSNCRPMKNIEVSDEVHAALQRLARDFNRTPDEVLASLLQVSAFASESGEPLAAFLIGPVFRANTTDADKYLVVLSWIAERHAAEFGEFIRSEAGDRRYLTMSRDEIVEACRHHQARQIDGTQYWAIMNIDAATRRRFLARMLEFIGYRDEMIDFACNLVGGGAHSRRRRVSLLVA